MDCPVCFTWEKEPKRLACSHTVCVECAQAMVAAAVSGGTSPTVKCSVCATQTPVPDGQVASLPTNLIWQKIQTVYKEHPPKPTETKTCFFCDHSKNIVNMRYCQDCHQDMCVQCTIAHMQNGTFQDHKVINTMRIYCQRHHEACDYLCQRCDKFLCTLCVHGNSGACNDHSEHIAPLEALKEEKLKSIEASQKKMKEEMRYLEEDAEDELSSIREKLKMASDVKSEVQKHAQKLIDDLKAKETAMIAALERWENASGGSSDMRPHE